MASLICQCQSGAGAVTEAVKPSQSEPGKEGEGHQPQVESASSLPDPSRQVEDNLNGVEDHEEEVQESVHGATLNEAG